jgi:caspase domain-containing protein|tara:strand:- start:59236 stop:61299 length:2064 start_codon:yes stop_codon:yes gene_type:complete
MKLLKLIGVIVLFCYSTLNAQELIELTSKKEFEEKGHNHISSAVLTTDGYHVVTGYTQNNSKGGKDIWVAKLSITGELIWQKTFGDINNDEGTAIVEALDGDYAVVGHSINSTSGYTEGWFLKLDQSGKLVSESTFKLSSYEKLNDIKIFDKKNFIVCGVRKEAGDDDLNFSILKINNRGVKIWQQHLGTQYFSDESQTLVVTAQQEILVAGYTTNNKKMQQVYLVKLDAYGKILFDEKLGEEAEFNSILSMEETPDGKVLMAGYTSVETNGAEDMLVMIYDRLKKNITKKSFGKHNADKLNSITTYKGGYLATGASKSLKGDREKLYMVKFDRDLNVEWERAYLDGDKTVGSDIIVNHDGFTIFGSIEKNKTENGLILNYKDNSSSLLSETTPEAKIAALQKHATKDGVSLLSNVLVQEFEDVTYRGSGDPLKGLNVSKSLEDLKVGNYYALIIGIDKYTGSWSPLKNAVNDAKTIETTLKSKYKFHQFKTLYNEQATRTNIIAAMEWLVANVKPDDNVFIYYSGHGEFKKELNKGYWVPFGATTMSTSNYISNSDIQTFIKGIQSQHTLLVADACFSGDIFRGNTMSVPFENSPKYYKKVHSLKSRQAMTSGGIEPVMDGGKDGHSVFAYYLLKALRENDSDMMDASQVFNKIKIPVYNNSDQSPDFNPISKSGDEGGQFIFMKK